MPIASSVDQIVLVAVLLDSLAVVTCGTLLYRYARLTSAHPGLIYLIFHLFFFSFRLYAILAGAPTLFTDSPGAIPVSAQEIAWAGLLGDVALVSMTVGLMLSSARDRRKAVVDSLRPSGSQAMLSLQAVRIVAAAILPAGIVVLVVVGAIPGAEQMAVDFGQWGSSSWLMIMQFWPVLSFLALIYVYGFQWKLIVPLCALLALMAVQGYNRFRVFLPIIFLLITWQTRVGSRWPRKWLVVSLLCLGPLIIPMKKAGFMIRQGQPLSNAAEIMSSGFSDAVRGTAPDQMQLDMFASVMWLVDRHGQYFYGSTVAPLIYLPIPKQLWPDKPALANWGDELKNRARPMIGTGMTVTYLGEAYANFGLVGIAAMPAIVGYLLGRFYFTAVRRAYFSVYRYMYVVIACSLIQFFRDGLISIVVFPLVNLMPLVVIALLSYIQYSYEPRTTTPNRRPQPVV